MMSLIHASALLSSASLITLMTGVVVSKVLAVCLGPSGFGFWGLFQSFIQLFEIIMSLGIGVALVRTASPAVAQKDYSQLAALQKAAFLMVLTFGIIVSVPLIILRNTLAAWFLGNAELGYSIIILIFAVFFRTLAGIQNSLLTSFHNPLLTAKAQVVDSITLCIVLSSLAYFFRFDGILAMAFLGAFASFFLSHVFLKRMTRSLSYSTSWLQLSKIIKSITSIGFPYTASLLVGSGTQLLLPVLVLHTLGQEGVGCYRAAQSVSMAYSSLMAAIFSKDYYPRLSKSVEEGEKISDIVDKQQNLVSFFCCPMIIAGVVVSPIMIPFLFSSKFTPAVDILEWILIGDLFKFSSWTMSFLILVRYRGLIFFLTELISGTLILCTSWFLVNQYGLSGIGLGYFLTYAVYFLVVLSIVHKDIQFRYLSFTNLLMFFSIIFSLCIRMISYTEISQFRNYIALFFILVISLLIIYRLRQKDKPPMSLFEL